MKAIKHLKTTLKHRHTVIVHCAKCGILCQGLMHDLSKYSPTEFVQGMKYYQGNRSPNEEERREKGYSEAWMHHKGRNRHHFEFWTDYDPIKRRIVPIKMPIRYVKEMFCDRVAATKVYQGKNYTPSSPYEYFAKGMARFEMHPETAALLERLLIMLRDEGEKKAFAYVKSLTEY